MKRDMDLVRNILLEIESWPGDVQPQKVQLKGYDPKIVNYHLKLLHEANYIDAVISKSQAGDTVLPRRLTWPGHEFIESAKNQTIWEKAKKVMDEAGGGSIDILKSVLIKLLSTEAIEIANRFSQ